MFDTLRIHLLLHQQGMDRTVNIGVFCVVIVHGIDDGNRFCRRRIVEIDEPMAVHGAGVLESHLE